jgi:hypothetical protein
MISLVRISKYVMLPLSSDSKASVSFHQAQIALLVKILFNSQLAFHKLLDPKNTYHDHQSLTKMELNLYGRKTRS